MTGLEPIARRDLLIIRRLLDEDYYLTTYSDIAAAKASNPEFDCAYHYATNGWKEGRNPSADFHTLRYLARNPHIAGMGVVPLVHYYNENPNSIRDKIIASYGRETYESVRPFFDATFYLLKNPDLRAVAEEDPDFDSLLHFLEDGWREGRDPSPQFSLREYCELNPDVGEAGINPLLHYATQGVLEGRPTKLPGGYRTRYLATLRSLADRAAAWKVGGTVAATKDADLLAGIVRAAIGDARKAVISLSHDNYGEVVGGVQLCLREEQREYEAAGIPYINLHPVQPLATIVETKEAGSYKLRILRDGDLVATATAANVVEALAKGLESAESIDLIVHAMHGHAPEFVSKVAGIKNVRQRQYWVHDFLSLCPGYNLLRNDVVYCGAPAPGSQACGVCVYGANRAEHTARMGKLFDSATFEVVAPSESALAIWRASSSYPFGAASIRPHRSFVAAPQRLRRVGDDVVRIAFLGYLTMLKGWNVFVGLLDRVFGADGYRFYAMGTENPKDERVSWVDVSLNGADNSGMVSAIAENEIDYVICWSLCPETFSFTAHEALSGGAMIITNPDSGNIAALVAERGCGLIFEREEDLFEHFVSGELLRQARAVTPLPDAPLEDPVDAEPCDDLDGGA